MSGLSVIGSFLKKEFRQILRSREMLIVLFALPAMQLLVMGFAVTNEVKNLTLSFFDYDNSPLSRNLCASFSQGDRFRVVPVSQAGKPEELLFRWQSKVVIVIPKGFARDVYSGRQVSLQVISDGIDGNTAALATTYAGGYLAEFAQKLEARKDLGWRALKKAPDKRINLISRMSFNPDLKSSSNIIPGIIAVLVTVTSMLLSAISLVKEKELGTLEQLMVTPVKKHQLLAGKLIPYLLITLLQMQVAMLLARIIFGVTVSGSYAVLLLFSLVYLFTTLGLGILISTRVQSQQQAMFFSWFIMVVAILLSGFFVPVRNMPEGIRLIAWFNPLSHYMTVLREIVVKGSGLIQLGREFAVLLGSGALIFGISVISFRKRV
ncbi:MAG TPA: ABC transporter permease [Candidatus Cloacimonadota bacterium]|nr:ABC transporter permease [Candidatus Cloacimonadota bacterium]